MPRADSARWQCERPTAASKGRNFWAATTMRNPDLPAEMLDHVVDFLQDATNALRSCCLVSKSWIPRARKHLFATVLFSTAARLQSWKETFRNPSTSPARYTKYLFINCTSALVDADAEEGGWIPTFRHVVYFEVDVREIDIDEPATSFVLFRGFSPALKSLSATFTTYSTSQILNFVYSFPLLEDLRLVTRGKPDVEDAEQSAAAQPSSPPAFTGSLKLFTEMGMEPIASGLLSLPSGLRFRELQLEWENEQDIWLTTMLVEKCYSTLESLHICCALPDELFSGSIDLTKATNLKSLVIVHYTNPRSVASILQAITRESHKNLQRILLDAPYIIDSLDINPTDPTNVRHAIGEAAYAGWLELDRLLVQLWESHSVRSEVQYYVPLSVGEENTTDCVKNLFPEATARGSIRLIGRFLGGEDWDY